MRRVWTALLAIVVAYSVWHFIYSGVVVPLEQPNLRDVGRELVPLEQFVQGGTPQYQPSHNRQYGPVFLFVMWPLVKVWDRDPVWLAQALYLLQLIAFAVAFTFTWLSLRLYLDEYSARIGKRPLQRHALTLLLILLWLNFAPAYYVITIKNVETWELMLISAAIYASLRRSDVGVGVGVGTAALTKLLPFAFFGMLVMRKPRAAMMAAATVLLILGAAHLTFGPEAGYRYLPRIAAAATGGSGYGNSQYALTVHESVSIRGLVDKAFGQLSSPYVPTSHETLHRYYVGLSPANARRSAIVGILLQIAGGLLFLFGLWHGASVSTQPLRTDLWCWAWTSAFMMILPPQSAFHYMILTLPAISFVVVSAAAETRRWQPRLLLAAGVVLLIANILPRTVINRLLFIDVVRARWGYDYLTLSETYQYFGFPLLGMLLLIAYLWTTRPALRGQPAG